jgi:hypothetical protein
MAARRFYNTVPQDETDNRPPTRVRGSHVSTMKVLVKGYPDKLPLYYVLAYVRGEDYTWWPPGSRPGARPWSG